MTFQSLSDVTGGPCAQRKGQSVTNLQSSPSSSTAPVLNIEGIRTLGDVAKCVDALCYHIHELGLAILEGRRPADGVLASARLAAEHAGVLSTALVHSGTVSVPSTLATVVRLRRKAEGAEKALARSLRVVRGFCDAVTPFADVQSDISVPTLHALAIEGADVIRAANERAS